MLISTGPPLYSQRSVPDGLEIRRDKFGVPHILADDEDAPAKQRHTAAQIHRRLRDEHDYPGGYAQVQRYVLKHRRRHRETFIPLGHLPGRRLEADFGHIHVDFPDGRRPVPFLVAGTRRVGIVQAKVAEKLARAAGVRVLECPWPVAPLRVTFWWDRRWAADPAHAWLRAVIADSMRKHSPPSPALA